jgi:putative addiction module component (TIGR02574 family)
MDTLAEGIIAQALQMPPQARALIAERLLLSLETESDMDVEVAWQQKVQHRMKEIENGEVVCIPWEQVLQRLRGNAHVAS